MPPKTSRIGFDRVFQERIVRLLFQDEGFAAASMGRLKPEHFEVPAHRWVAKTIFWSHAQLGIHPSTMVIKQEREKQISFKLIKPEAARSLREFCRGKMLQPVPDKTYVKREVQRFIKEQTIKSAVLTVAEDLLPKRKMEEIDKVLADAIEVDITGDNSVGFDPGTTYLARVKKRLRDPEEGIPTGINGIDRLMSTGGVKLKQIAFVHGITGAGKTNWLLDRAVVAMLSGYPTVFYSLELDVEGTILDRIDARVTHVPIKSLKTNPDEVKAGWKKIPRKVRSNLVVKEFPMNEFTVGMMRSHFRQLERRAFYPKLVVIDYIDLMQPSVIYSDNINATEGHLVRDVKSFAQREKVAIWSGIQGNRDAMKNDKGDVGLGDTSGSIKKVQLADVGIGLNQNAKEKKMSYMRASMLKNRNGPSGREVPIAVEHEICRFKDR